MASEPERGCGFRKLGALYLVGGRLAAPCGLLPRRLEVCPTCGGGVKQSRGWQWVLGRLVARAGDQNGCLVCGTHNDSAKMAGKPLTRHCIMHHMAHEPDLEVGLLWVGEKFYTPSSFCEESARLGVSKRISAIPQGLILGETWVLLAHPAAVRCQTCDEYPEVCSSCSDCKGKGGFPGIFAAFVPTAIDQLVTESQARDTEKMKGLSERGITPVVVPDDDADHWPE